MARLKFQTLSHLFFSSDAKLSLTPSLQVSNEKKEKILYYTYKNILMKPQLSFTGRCCNLLCPSSLKFTLLYVYIHTLEPFQQSLGGH